MKNSRKSPGTSLTIRRFGIRVQFGELYRLSSLKTASLQAVQYVRDNQSALFLFLDHERFGEIWHTVKLRGLKENAVYEYELDGKILRKTGAYLMQFGLSLHMKGDYDSHLIIFTEKEAWKAGLRFS